MKILIVSIMDLSSLRGPRFGLNGPIEKLRAFGCEILKEEFCPFDLSEEFSAESYANFAKRIAVFGQEQGVALVLCDVPIPLLAIKMREAASGPILFVVDSADANTKSISLGSDFFNLRVGEIEEWLREEKRDCAIIAKRNPEDFRWHWRKYLVTPNKIAINQTLRQWIWAVKSGQTLVVCGRGGAPSIISDSNSEPAPTPIGFVEKSIGVDDLQKFLEVLASHEAEKNNQ